ncbi:MAG: hypothetical protein MUF13_14640, partial [Akkermansiaceae bacterium]|nr:hypothetical protein [Akkermansiaceae bacterium]
IFDNLYGCAHGSAFADLLAQAYQQHYGHAGIAFIQNLLTSSVLRYNILIFAEFFFKEGTTACW